MGEAGAEADRLVAAVGTSDRHPGSGGCRDVNGGDKTGHVAVQK